MIGFCRVVWSANTDLAALPVWLVCVPSVALPIGSTGVGVGVEQVLSYSVSRWQGRRSLSGF